MPRRVISTISKIAGVASAMIVLQTAPPWTSPLYWRHVGFGLLAVTISLQIIDAVSAKLRAGSRTQMVWPLAEKWSTARVWVVTFAVFAAAAAILTVTSPPPSTPVFWRHWGIGVYVAYTLVGMTHFVLSMFSGRVAMDVDYPTEKLAKLCGKHGDKELERQLMSLRTRGVKRLNVAFEPGAFPRTNREPSIVIDAIRRSVDRNGS